MMPLTIHFLLPSKTSSSPLCVRLFALAPSACVTQTNIDEELGCLPIFIAGCKQMLVVAGPSCACARTRRVRVLNPYQPPTQAHHPYGLVKSHSSPAFSPSALLTVSSASTLGRSGPALVPRASPGLQLGLQLAHHRRASATQPLNDTPTAPLLAVEMGHTFVSRTGSWRCLHSIGWAARRRHFAFSRCPLPPCP